MQIPGSKSAHATAAFYTLPANILVARTLALVALLALLLYPLSRSYFLLYHTLVEFFFITVAFTIFSIGWNARHFVKSNSLMVLAVGHLALCPIQFLHVMTYTGLDVLPVTDANPATQLWIAARYLDALIFLLAALSLPQRKPRPPYLVLAIAMGLSFLLLVTIWPLQLFPDCFHPQTGLTDFKIASEYLVCVLLGVSMLLFWRRRGLLDRRYLMLLFGSLGMAISAELTFTLYQDIYGVTNFLGHFLKLAAVLFLYRALISGALRTPYSVLFKDLSRAKEDLDSELEQRRQTEIELREANRELDAFVRTVSHDLRSPLTPIIGLAGYLQEHLANRDDPATLEALRSIESQGQRMARILTDLLAFARAGHQHHEKTEVAPLDETLDRVLTDLGSQILSKGVKIERSPLPPLVYPRTQTFLIFSNLLSNALKYAGDRQQVIEITGFKNGEGSVEVRVVDHGPGIPEAERSKVFEIFYRQRCHEDVIGSGIGLATVKKLIERLGGSIRISDTPGGGATFSITLPPPSQLQTSSRQES